MKYSINDMYILALVLEKMFRYLGSHLLAYGIFELDVTLKSKYN